MKSTRIYSTIGGLSGWLIVLAVMQPSYADWTSFRNGGTSYCDSTLPTEWSMTAGIAWQHELKGYGQSAPVIDRDAVYTTSVSGSMCETCLIECRELTTGEVRWTYRQQSTHGHPSNYMHARAAPSPVVDEQGVYAFFETGDLVAIDRDGNLMWSTDESQATGKFDNSHGVGSSLAQNATHLFLNLEHGGPSSLTAIDKRSGESAWKVKRKSSKSWSSPIVAEVGDRQQVILSSGGSVAGYDAADGKLAWSIDGVEGNSVPSPTIADHLLIVGARLPEFASPGDMRSNCCLDISDIQDGKPRVAWRANKAICNYASPIVFDGYAYFLSKSNVLHCLDAQTGAIAYRERIDGDCWATPIVANDLLYFFCKNGQCHVVRSGPKFEMLSSNRLWDPDDPPAPEAYAEASPGVSSHGHNAAKHGGDGTQSPSAGGPGGGFAARLKAGDRNGDGVLETAEIPETLRGMVARGDTDADGKLSNEEIDAMAKSFAERRKDSAASSRDPIVYGVAATAGRIIVRTGTRLFAIAN